MLNPDFHCDHSGVNQESVMSLSDTFVMTKSAVHLDTYEAEELAAIGVGWLDNNLVFTIEGI